MTKISIRTVQLGLRKQQNDIRWLGHRIRQAIGKPMTQSQADEIINRFTENNKNINKLCDVLTELALDTKIPTNAERLAKEMHDIYQKKRKADELSNELEKDLLLIEKELEKEVGEEEFNKILKSQKKANR